MIYLNLIHSSASKSSTSVRHLCFCRQSRLTMRNLSLRGAMPYVHSVVRYNISLAIVPKS